MRAEKLEIGCSIHGLDGSRITAEQKQQVMRLLYANRLVVLKGQQLDEQAYCNFAHAIGTPEPYLQQHYRHPDFPLIFVSSNLEDEGRQIGVARTGGYWHSDGSFQQTPKIITMLMPKVMPKEHVRTTKFIDMAAVYAALPRAMKDKLAGARLVHSGRWHYKIRPEDVGKDMDEVMQWIDGFAPPATHPAVVTHPATGEAILYANRGFTLGIANRPQEESTTLLQALFDFSESSRFVREVCWEMGDIIIWDNRFLAHRSGRNDGPEEPTVMHRISLRDDYPLCASQLAPAAAAE